MFQDSKGFPQKECFLLEICSVRMWGWRQNNVLFFDHLHEHGFIRWRVALNIPIYHDL